MYYSPIKMKELPETERPYEKLEQYGEKMLTNAELLAIIIKTGTKEETAIGLAHQILKLNQGKQDNLNFSTAKLHNIFHIHKDIAIK